MRKSIQFLRFLKKGHGILRTSFHMGENQGVYSFFGFHSFWQPLMLTMKIKLRIGSLFKTHQTLVYTKIEGKEKLLALKLDNLLKHGARRKTLLVVVPKVCHAT
jgi:hypothetical protein